METAEIETFNKWAIVELMGHVKMAGKVTEEELFGSKMGRIDIPNAEGFVTQFFSGSSVYRLTPCTEPIARAAAQNMRNHQPVSEWDLTQFGITAPSHRIAADQYDEQNEDENGDYSEEHF